MENRSVKILANTAIFLGICQFMVHANDIFNTDIWKTYSFPRVLLGLCVSIAWTLYHFNKGGLNYSVVYSSFGLFMYLYVIQKLLKNRRSGIRRNNDSTSDESNH